MDINSEGGNGREVGRAKGLGWGVGKGRTLYLNNNKKINKQINI